MPETVSAPSTSAPAAPAGGGTPSWGGGDIGAMLSGVTSDAPSHQPQPAAPPVPTAPAAPAQTAAAQPPAPVPAGPVSSPESEAPLSEPEKPVDPENPEPAATPKPVNEADLLLAGRFKAASPEVSKDPGVQALTKAYHESGVEGRRLHGENVSLRENMAKMESGYQALKAELDMTKLEKELGPEPKDPTPEELAQWSPAQVAKFYADKTERKTTKQRLEDKRAQQESQFKAESENRRATIQSAVSHMAQDTEHFPDYADLVPTIQDFLGVEPGLIGLPKSPLVTYLAAYGHRALQKDLRSKSESARAAEAAKAKAKGKVPVVSGAGGGGEPQPTPKPAGQPEPGSDAWHNARLVATQREQKSVLPFD